MNRKQISKYLPDQDDKSEPQVDRDFVFTIVNTVDPNYFPSQLARIENERQEAYEKVKEDVIEVRPEIMQLLESFGASLLKSSTNKASAGRSLALLKKNSKKRTRA